MTGPDDEFDDFLARRKPVFRRSTEDPFEPPEELDRIVLRQAREAIERERPERVYHGPRWGMPVALAATLLLVFTVVLHLGVPSKAPVPEVTVQNIDQQIEYPDAAPRRWAKCRRKWPASHRPPAMRARRWPSCAHRPPGRATASDRTPGGFASEEEGTRYAPARLRRQSRRRQPAPTSLHSRVPVMPRQRRHRSS